MQEFHDHQGRCEVLIGNSAFVPAADMMVFLDSVNAQEPQTARGTPSQAFPQPTLQDKGNQDGELFSLSELEPEKKMSTVFRVLRTWETTKSKTMGLKNFHAILLDQSGELNHAVITKELNRAHVKKMREKELIVIKNYSVADSVKKWKPTPYNRLLDFSHDTEVYSHNDQRIVPSIHKFNLVDLNDIWHSFKKYEHYIDVMGIVRGISDLIKVKVSFGHTALRRDITIATEIGWCTRVTLWGENARNLTRNCFVREDKKSVLIITSVIVERHNGVYYLSSTEATKVYIDLDIPEVQTFKKGYTLRTPLNEIRCENPLQKPIETALFYNRMGFGEAYTLTIPSENLGMIITCKGTIKGVIMGTTWYYLACANCCPTSVDLKAWTSVKCTCNEPYIEPRFKLELEIWDENEYGTTKLTALGGDMANILFDDNKAVSQLKGLMYSSFLNKEETLTEKVPLLRRLDNRRFVFELEIIQKGSKRTIFLKDVYPLNHELEDKYDLEQQILKFRKEQPVQGIRQHDAKKEPNKSLQRVQKEKYTPLTPLKTEKIRYRESLATTKSTKRPRVKQEYTEARKEQYGMLSEDTYHMECE